MKNFVKTKAFKILVIILGCIIGLSAAFLASVATVFAVRKTAVVAIPGLLCSSLVDTETEEIFYDPLDTDTYGYSFDDFNETKMFDLITRIAAETDTLDKIWAVLDGEEGNFLEKFALKEDGTPEYPSVAIQWDHDGYAKYGAMTMMRKPYEHFANLYKNKKNYDAFVFQYDWRRDNRIAAEQLIEATKDYDDVIIVAHSMGNIVASLAMAKSEDFRKKVILNCSYAAPYLGSFNALDILEDGESTVGGLLDMARTTVNGNKALKLFLGDIVDQATDLCYNQVLPTFRRMPGIAQLLPCIELVCPDGEHSNLTVNGTAITTKEQLLAYYESCFWAHEGEDVNAPLRSWIADLSEYWDAFYVNGVHASKLVNTYYFAGVDYDTTESMTIVKDGDQRVTSLSTTKTRGDGTVNFRSATVGGNERILETTGYPHTNLGTAFATGLVAEQTATAVSSIDNPYKIMAIKIKYPLQ